MNSSTKGNAMTAGTKVQFGSQTGIITHVEKARGTTPKLYWVNLENGARLRLRKGDLIVIA